MSGPANSKEKQLADEHRVTRRMLEAIDEERQSASAHMQENTVTRAQGNVSARKQRDMPTRVQ